MNSIKNQIENIIDSLGHNEKLETVLLKTKTLLSRLGEKESANWIDKELKGYHIEEELPEYRIINCSLFLGLINNRIKQTGFPAPISHLKKDLQKDLTTKHFGYGIAGIENIIEIAISKKQDTLKIDSNIRPEMWNIFKHNLNPTLQVFEVYALPPLTFDNYLIFV
jgi:hypothetical protein